MCVCANFATGEKFSGWPTKGIRFLKKLLKKILKVVEKVFESFQKVFESFQKFSKVFKTFLTALKLIPVVYKCVSGWKGLGASKSILSQRIIKVRLCQAE